MRKQAGQAFILVLILLGVGALLVVPALRLTDTSLKSSQIVERQVKGLYAADAAQEYILWKLLYDNLGAQFTVDGQSASFNFDVCDVPVGVTIVMRATEGTGGMVLATEHLIRPTKTVVPFEVDNGYSGPYTYTIKLEQLSEDNSQGLDAVYDVLPKGLEYIPGSSRLRVDGGEWTQDIGEPSIYIEEGEEDEEDRHRLRWPFSDYFTEPMRIFDVRQVKEIKFDVQGPLSPNKTFYNWVLLKLGNIDTLSGPVAPIKVETGAGHVGGLLEVSKKSYPEIIQPGVETTIRYEVKITNLDGRTHQIQSLTDYLPPGFDYCTTSPPEPENAITHATCQLPYGITTSNPTSITLMTFDTPEVEDDRYRLYWEFSPPVDIAEYKDEEDILYLNFYARTTKDVSGSYFNEVIVEPFASIDSIFQPDDMTVTRDDFNTTYSWNTGAVIVPAYDSTSEAEGITINSNMSLILGGITITSWQVD